LKHIVFSGQLANGKDVLADMVAQDFNGNLDPNSRGYWHRTAFAGAVKDIYCNAFGVDRDFVEKWKRHPEPPPGFLQTVRKSLQFIGDGFRQIQGDVWINIALRDPRNVVISDGRYINEARAAHKLGGVNVLVWRPGFENNDPNLSEAQILPIIKWCLATNQNGPITHPAMLGSIMYDVEPSFVKTVEPVEGIENYDYFFRNDVEMEQLRDKVKAELIPFLRDRYSGR